MSFNPFSGIVIWGKKLGRTIGFPTANIALTPGILEDGVYTFDIDIAWASYHGVGTYRETLELCEVHIFDFDGDIYGQEILITPTHKIRDNQKFASFDLLKEQIKKDVKIAREMT